MDLYFLRHGDAEPRDYDKPDHERELTPKGLKVTRAEAQAMARLGVRPDVILTSPYIRARQTAEIVAEVLGLPEPEDTDELECGCGLGELQDALEPYLDKASVMVVGHEPDFGILIGTLSGGTRVDVKKGGLARLTIDRIEPGGGLLRWLLTPKHLMEG